MPYTFATQGDTAQSISYDYLGYHDADFADRLWRENENFMCRHLGTPSQFAVGQAVWVPEDNHPMGPTAHHLQMPHFDRLTPGARNILSGLVHTGHKTSHLTYFASMAKMAEEGESAAENIADDFFKDLSDEESDVSHFMTLGIATVDSAIDATVGVNKKFKSTMQTFHRAIKMEHHLQQEVFKTVEDTEKARLKRMLKFVVKKRIECQQQLRRFKRVKFSEAQAKVVFDKTEHSVKTMVRKRFVQISNIFDTLDIAEFVEKLEKCAKCLVALEAVIDIYRLFTDPEQRKHWVYYLLKDAGNISLGLVEGLVIESLVGLLVALTPELEILLVVVAAIVGGLAYFYFENAVDHYLFDAFLKKPIDDIQLFVSNELDNLKELI